MNFVLNRKLTLQNQLQLPDGAGGFVEDWQNLGTIWANIEAQSGNTETGIDGDRTRVRYQIIVRAAPMGSSRRPAAGQRLTEGTRNYFIDAVSEGENPLYLVIWAREVNAI